MLNNPQDLIMILGVVAALLLAMTVAVGVLAAMKTFQVRQFQDMLFKADRKIDTLERRNFNILNAVPVALVETDSSGKFTFANKSAHTLLGRKDNELIGLRFHSATWGITFPDGRVVPADMMPIARTLRGQTVKGFQHLIVNHGSHEKILVSVTSMPILNGNGEVIGSTSAMVELESTAGEGVDDLTGLWRGHWFTAATLPFWGLDSKGQIVDINNAALDAFEIRREDVLGKNWTQIFVADADFQRAIDYLGDSQDETSPDPAAAIPLTLRHAGGDMAVALSAWAVHTHEGGDHGLTVMALPAESLPVTTLPGAADAPKETEMPATPVHLLTDDDAQELEDLRNAEVALASLGIGVWQYDREAETMVEDEGMRRLIGREYEGGPTLISDDDQASADAEFARLLAGESDALNMDIRVVDTNGQTRWITLRGQAETIEGGERQIYGVAFDSTALKTPAPATDDVATAVEAARAEALETARREYEAELEKVRAEQAPADPYGWSDAAPPAQDDETVAELKTQLEAAQIDLRNAALAMVELRTEIEALKTQPADTSGDPENSQSLQSHIESLQAELADATAYHGALQQQIDELSARPEPEMPEPVVVREPDPAVIEENESLKAQIEGLRVQLDAVVNAPLPVADTSEHEARIAALESQLQETDAARNELQVQLSDILLAPRLVEVKDERDSQIEALKAELEDATSQGKALATQLQALADAPPPEPDTSEWEAKVAAVDFEKRKWQAAYDDVAARLAAVPPPPAIDVDALTAKLEELQAGLAQSLSQQAELQTGVAQAQAQAAETQSRLEQVSAALTSARRFETVGRLTGDVAQDFAQMLGVINGALDVMSRQADSEQIKRLAEAALAAGKRGERLTRQLQAFQSEDY